MTIKEAVDFISNALKDERPLVLFAGQQFDPASNTILEGFFRHLNYKNLGHGWNDIFQEDLTADDLAWLSERFDRNVPSDALQTIFDIPWSAVFTSSIDPRFSQRFETRGRQPEQILSADVFPRVPRSRSRPPVHYLFGKSNETVDYARAPRKQSELTIRVNLHSTALLRRIPEAATARGYVIMDGYCPLQDWLPLDSLLSPLYNQVGIKIFCFGIKKRWNSPLADELTRRNTLVFIEPSLEEIIDHMKNIQIPEILGSAAPDEPGIVTISNNTILDITPALRLRVEASAAIVDDEWTKTPEALLSSEDLRDAFYRFHGALGNFRLLVEGIIQDFAIEREFEQTLWKVVNSRLKRLGQANFDDIVILHGQSGTGKTVALARLTFKIRTLLGLPVIVATNRFPNHADVEAFCFESERLGATATVLICDNLQAPRRYDDLASALRSLGRRLLIVGVCYRMENYDKNLPNHRFVEASSAVSKSELNNFKDLLAKFDHDPSLTDAENSPERGPIFAMLYRRLPASRERLAAGVALEARAQEGTLRTRARQVPRSNKGLSSIAEQLINLGIANPNLAIFDDDEKLAALGLDGAGRLIDQVMVAGRLNCPVPVNLIFRSLSETNSLDLDQIIHLFSDIDLFRWRKNEEGSDLSISPRIRLEAELICARRLSLDQEIERLIELIGSVRFELDSGAERTFLLDLLAKIGRTGLRGQAYSSGYLRFADALQRLRETHNIFEPALVLRECVFRRQAVFLLQKNSIEYDSSDERLVILDQARHTVEETLYKIDNESIRVPRRTKQSLVAERSAIYGYLAVQHAKSEIGEEFWSDYLAARTASEKAMGFGGNYHPVEIALWTARDVLEIKRHQLSKEQQAELLADLYATVDIADDIFGVQLALRRFGKNYSRETSFDDKDHDEGMATIDQKARYLERRSRIAIAIGNSKMEDETLAELESISSSAVTFLVAKRKAERIYFAEPPFNNQNRQIAKDAADYITNRADSGVILDDRCQRLLLKLRWAQVTGERLMFRQRGRTPSELDQILELRMIVNTLNEQAGVYAGNRERYLEAVLCWLANDTNRALEIWRSLSRDTEYEDKSRVVRWLVTTNSNGSPIEFRGRVEKKRDNDWRLRVDNIDKPIAMLVRDFSNEDLSHGRELRGFGIAFNYIGPIADPLSRSVRT